MMYTWEKEIIEVVFTGCLFFNAFLFIPQALKIWRQKHAGDLSLITFAGFNFIQLFALLYGVVQDDHVLMVGYSFSIVTCGSVTFLILWFRRKAKK